MKVLTVSTTNDIWLAKQQLLVKKCCTTRQMFKHHVGET